MSKLLAVDFGMKRIGFAIGSTDLHTASPIEPITRKNSKQAIRHIEELVKDYDIERIVLGYPLHMDGTPGFITEQVEHFARRLKKAVEPAVNVDFVDERLSSFEAEEELKTLKPDPRRRKAFIDSMAAVVLLRRFMETDGAIDNLDNGDNSI
jgi:putative Holliday junction resolvase